MFDMIIKYTAPIWFNVIVWLFLIGISGSYICVKIAAYIESWNEKKKMFWLKIGSWALISLGLLILYGIGIAWCGEFSWWGW